LLGSPHLVSLRNLHLHVSDLGDEGCKDILESGILKRLKVLDLRYGCVHDEGAGTLAACPDVRNLERVCLANNELTEVRKVVLQRLGIPVVCDSQYDVGSDAYLFMGDME